MNKWFDSKIDEGVTDFSSMQFVERQYFGGEGKSNRCVFPNVILENSSFRDCQFRKCSFEGTDLSNVKFFGCTFYECTFTGANLTLSYFKCCSMYEVSFVDCKLGLLTVGNSTLSYTSFEGSTVAYLDFDSSSINCVMFKSVTSGEITRCCFNGTIFSNKPAGLEFKDNTFDDTTRDSIFDLCNFLPRYGNVFTAYKKVCKYIVGTGKVYGIATLEIPADAYRSNGVSSDKFKVSKAIVNNIKLFIPDLGEVESDSASSMYDPSFEYVVGQTVHPDMYSNNMDTCGKGIHCFITEELARNYYL